VTYSTCSIHEEENEGVVQAALKAQEKFRLIQALPEWKRRGLTVFEGAENCIRTVPEEDKTHGFFVACFERISEKENEDLRSDKEKKSKRNAEEMEASSESIEVTKKRKKKKKKKKKKKVTQEHEK